MIVHRRNAASFALLLLIGFCLTACSTAKNLSRKISPKKIVQTITFQDDRVDSLKKRVLLLPFLDQAKLGDERIDRNTGIFVNLLQNSDSLIVYRSADPITTTMKLRSSDFGLVIDPKRAEKAEEMGMNVLLTVIVNPFEFRSKKKGIWPFRRAVREADISLSVNALDITNGTLITTHLESRELPLDDAFLDWGMETDRTPRALIADRDLDDALTEILEDLASALIEALNHHPWLGRILSVKEDEVIINAGRDVGVEEGQTFEIYGQGEQITAKDGRSYYLRGPKVGEIKTVRVMDSSAAAVPVSASDMLPGNLIRPAVD